MKTHDDTEAVDDNLDAEIDALGDDPKALKKLLRGKVAKEAIKTLVGVCRDPRAPAPAKATSGAALLRAGGHFEKFDADEDEAAPVTVEELERIEARLKAVVDAMPPEPAPQPSGKSAKRGKQPGGLFD
jgi:hypothetical protein